MKYRLLLMTLFTLGSVRLCYAQEPPTPPVQPLSLDELREAILRIEQLSVAWDKIRLLEDALRDREAIAAEYRANQVEALRLAKEEAALWKDAYDRERALLKTAVKKPSKVCRFLLKPLFLGLKKCVA